MNTATNTTFAPFMPGIDGEDRLLGLFTAKASQAQNADEARSLLGFAEKITGGLGRLYAIIQDAVTRSLNGDVAAALDSRREPSTRELGSQARAMEMSSAIAMGGKNAAAKKSDAARLIACGHILTPALALLVAIDLATHNALEIEAVDYTKTNLKTTLRLSGPISKDAIAIEMAKAPAHEDQRYHAAPSSHYSYQHTHSNTPHQSLEIKAAENAQFCTGAFKAQKLNVANLDGLVSPLNGVNKAQFSFTAPKNLEDQANIFSGANLNPSQKPLFGGFDSKGPLGMASFTVSNGPKFGL